MARRFDFVSVPQPTKPGFGLTSADRQKVRSRAAKTDPFAVEVKRHPKKDRLLSNADTQLSSGGAGRASSHSGHRNPKHADVDASIASDILQLQKSALNLRVCTSISPELDSAEQVYDEGYFSKRVSPEEAATLMELPEMDLDPDIEVLEESNRIIDDRDQHLLTAVTPLQGYISAGRIDPFWTFPIRFQKCLPAVIQHEVQHLAPVVPGLDYGEEHTLLRWFSLGIHEPAHLFATLAFAAAHLLDAGSTLATQEDIFYLKGSAIAAVNAALGDPDRAVSSPVIAAVMCLAAFEFAFGDTDSYHTHMDGSKQMIAMRGGIQSLEPWMSRLLKWIGSSSAVWKIFWPYSRQMDLSDNLTAYNRTEVAAKTVNG